MEYDIRRSGAYIRNLRIQEKYTQEDLAKAMNIDRSFLSRIESGKKGCSVDLLLQLSEFFHVPLDALVLGGFSEGREMQDAIQQIDKEISTLIEHMIQFRRQLNRQ